MALWYSSYATTFFFWERGVKEGKPHLVYCSALELQPYLLGKWGNFFLLYSLALEPQPSFYGRGVFKWGQPFLLYCLLPFGS